MDDNEAVIRRLHEEVVNRDRLDLLDEIFAADYVNHGPFPPGVATREDSIRFNLVRELGFPDIQTTVDEVVSSGDRVAFRVTIRGSHTGEFMGLPPTGKAVTATSIHIARLENGRIAEHWGVLDTIEILRQLGAWPPARSQEAGASA